MKIFGLLLSLILTQTCFAQFKLVKFDKKSIPRGVKYTGDIVRGVRWADSTGDNVVILTVVEKKGN